MNTTEEHRTVEKRRPLHPDLLNAVRATCAECVLAGVTADEAIDLCRRTMSRWIDSGKPVFAS